MNEAKTCIRIKQNLEIRLTLIVSKMIQIAVYIQIEFSLVHVRKRNIFIRFVKWHTL